MKKSLCDGPGCGKQMMDAPQVRLGSKKAPGGCKCGGKCGPCKAKAKHAESMEEEGDEPDGDRDDANYSSSVVVTDSMTAFRFDQPNCKPGNKACGGRCIPQEYDCELAQANRQRSKKAIGSYAASMGAGAGAAAFGHAATKSKGKLRNAYIAGTVASGLGAAALGAKTGYEGMKISANQLQQAKHEKNSFKKGAMQTYHTLNGGFLVKPDKKRGDSFWAAGFTGEPSEAF